MKCVWWLLLYIQNSVSFSREQLQSQKKTDGCYCRSFVCKSLESIALASNYCAQLARFIFPFKVNKFIFSYHVCLLVTFLLFSKKENQTSYHTIGQVYSFWCLPFFYKLNKITTLNCGSQNGRKLNFPHGLMRQKENFLWVQP